MQMYPSQQQQQQQQQHQQHFDLDPEQVDFHATGALDEYGGVLQGANILSEEASQNQISEWIAGNGGEPLRIERDEILFRERVGVGWFATVWLGEWRNTRIAVKHMTVTDAMPEAEVRLRVALFHEEMRLMSCVPPHAHVMRLAGFSNSHANPLDLALVTDFMVNTDLSHVLADADTHLSNTRIMYIVAGIAAGLAHVHAHEILHRDIAARNVFMDRNLSPRLGDFGLALRANDQGMIENVPECKWLAPEAVRERYYCVPVTDHQLLTNRGFLFFEQVLAAVAYETTPTGGVRVRDWRGLCVAGFDAARQRLCFEEPRALVVNAADAPLVHLTGAASRVSLSVTPNHELWVRRSGAPCFAKMSASRLVGGGEFELLACDGERSVTPVAIDAIDVQRDARGATWCCEMPSGFVVVRRAVRDGSRGSVVAASRATIQGNSKKSDVWAFGQTVVEVLTRREPFPDLTLEDVMSRMRSNSLQPILPLSHSVIKQYPQLGDCLKSLLAIDYNMRSTMSSACLTLGPPSLYRGDEAVSAAPNISKGSFWKRLLTDLSTKRTSKAPPPSLTPSAAAAAAAATTGADGTPLSPTFGRRKGLFGRIKDKLNTGGSMSSASDIHAATDSGSYPALSGGSIKVPGSGSPVAAATESKNEYMATPSATDWLSEQVVVSSVFFGMLTYVFFDLLFADQRRGRVVFELYGQAAPKTCEHFRLMCALPNARYRNVPIVPINQTSATVGDDLSPMVQMSLQDERGAQAHDAPYLLSVPRNDTSAQFLVTFSSKASMFDQTRMVIGRAMSGLEVLDAVRAVAGNTPSATQLANPLVAILNCGQLDANGNELNRAQAIQASVQQPPQQHQQQHQQQLATAMRAAPPARAPPGGGAPPPAARPTGPRLPPGAVAIMPVSAQPARSLQRRNSVLDTSSGGGASPNAARGPPPIADRNLSGRSGGPQTSFGTPPSASRMGGGGGGGGANGNFGGAPAPAPSFGGGSPVLAASFGGGGGGSFGGAPAPAPAAPLGFGSGNGGGFGPPPPARASGGGAPSGFGGQPPMRLPAQGAPPMRPPMRMPQPLAGGAGAPPPPLSPRKQHHGLPAPPQQESDGGGGSIDAGLQQYRWYQPYATRSSTEEYLSHPSRQVRGNFVVRPSSQAEALALSVVVENGSVAHSIIKRTEAGFVVKLDDEVSPPFPTVLELLVSIKPHVDVAMATSLLASFGE
jgi:serine/threonine protein kinase/cyclophilin family peptidyl-prolyl cis-trans isomerase